MLVMVVVALDESKCPISFACSISYEVAVNTLVHSNLTDVEDVAL
jgi:hypothetical protein